MNRPYIFCHMLTSLDGKITGNYMKTPQSKAAGQAFYKLAFGPDAYYKHQGWLSGRVTTDENFTHYLPPALDESAPVVPDGDFAAQPDYGMFYVSVDPHGKLGWTQNSLRYRDTTAHVIELLTQQVNNAYKAFLRKQGISYIIAGNAEPDYALALSKLKDLFHIEMLMLGGGSVLNWSFLQAGMCDEVSLVLAPAVDGKADAPSAFRAKDGLSDNQPITFTFQEARPLPENALWLRYTVNSDTKALQSL